MRDLSAIHRRESGIGLRVLRVSTQGSGGCLFRQYRGTLLLDDGPDTDPLDEGADPDTSLNGEGILVSRGLP